MEILFLSITLALPAVAVGLHWTHLIRKGCGNPTEAVGRPDDQQQPARVEPLTQPVDCVNTAVAEAEVQFAAIMAVLERLDRYIDQLPDKVQ